MCRVASSRGAGDRSGQQLGSKAVCWGPPSCLGEVGPHRIRFQLIGWGPLTYGGQSAPVRAFKCLNPNSQSNLNVNLINKNTFTETSRIMFDQLPEPHGPATRTHQVNHPRLLQKSVQLDTRATLGGSHIPRAEVVLAGAVGELGRVVSALLKVGMTGHQAQNERPPCGESSGVLPRLHGCRGGVDANHSDTCWAQPLAKDAGSHKAQR